MRRGKQQLPENETLDILQRGTSGVLALSGDDGYLYAVPLSYTYADGKILFHGAKSGHKFDAIQAGDKASFCVIDEDTVIPARYTTHYRSVIAFGRIRIVTDPAEMRRLVTVLAEKYRPGAPQETQAEVDKEMPALCVMELTIEHLTGKESRELMQQRYAAQG